MSNAPKWITEALEASNHYPGVPSEMLAVDIAEAFPVHACMDSAIVSLTAQLKCNGVALPESEIRAIAGNVISAIAGAVCAPESGAVEYLDEFAEMSAYLGNLGAPWSVDGKHLRLAARLEHITKVRRTGGRLVTAEQLERLRAAHRAFWQAYDDGDISDTHHEYEADEPHEFECYAVGRVAGLDACQHCAQPRSAHPRKTEHECPEDDTCECAGRAALNELQHAIDDIAGKITP